MASARNEPRVVKTAGKRPAGPSGVSLHVFPRDASEVARVVKLANKHNVPLGISDCAGPLGPCEGMVSLDFSAMKGIKEIRVKDFLCVVEPGVSLGVLSSALKRRGFFFPPNPLTGPATSIGRIVVQGGTFSRACKYGPVRNHVLALDMVTPTGELVSLGTKTLKNSSGLQIERVIPGSKGVLGIPTEITLAVRPRPEKRVLLIALFASPVSASAAASSVVGSSVTPSAIEIFMLVSESRFGLEALRGTSGHGIALLVELDGHRLGVKRESEEIERILRSAGAARIGKVESGERIEEWCRARAALLGLEAARSAVSVPLLNAASVLSRLVRVSKKNGANIVCSGYLVDDMLSMHVAVRTRREGLETCAADVEDRWIDASFPRVPRAGTSDRVVEGLRRALDPRGVMSPAGMCRGEVSCEEE